MNRMKNGDAIRDLSNEFKMMNTDEYISSNDLRRARLEIERFHRFRFDTPMPSNALNGSNAFDELSYESISLRSFTVFTAHAKYANVYTVYKLKIYFLQFSQIFG